MIKGVRMPSGARASLSRAGSRKSTAPGVASFACSDILQAPSGESTDLHEKIDAFLVNQRKSIVRKLFGREHQIVFEAIFFGLQMTKMRLFLNDIHGSEKLITRLKSFVKKYIKNIREYIDTQSENIDSNNILVDASLLSKICADWESYGALRRREITQLIKEENREIVSELHDDVLQGLACILMGLQICERLYERKPKRAIREIGEIELLVWDLNKRIEKLCKKDTLFSPSKMRLVPILKDYVRCLRSIVDVDICLTSVGNEDKLSFPTKVNLLYIAREATTNAIRHANACRVVVEVQIRKDKVVLRVTDDGRGFAAKESLSKAKVLGYHGLVGILERAKELGGKLSIDSCDREGSRISVQIPMSQ